jgi:hypothetical protein
MTGWYCRILVIEDIKLQGVNSLAPELVAILLVQSFPGLAVPFLHPKVLQHYLVISINLFVGDCGLNIPNTKV